MSSPTCCGPAREDPTRAGNTPDALQVSADAPNGHPIRNPQGGAVQRGAVWDDLVQLDGGAFLMGTEDQQGFPADGEGPLRQVRLSPFKIGRYTVSNRQFSEFVDDTGYVTEGERIGWCFVFHLLVSRLAHKRGHVREVPGLAWWRAVDGACWRRPEGKGSSIRDRMDHPVVHVSWNDAQAFCRWSGTRLPTEAEWEYAARGGLVQNRYVWGDELSPGGKHYCNIWQGNFPTHNSGEDGWVGTCPVRQYSPNGFGLYNMAGNVWEWCADWWSSSFHVDCLRIDPRGPDDGNARVMRGGSYLCHHSYCNRYRVAARSSNTPESATGNMGFRCTA